MPTGTSDLSEIRWEGRLWTFFQIGMVALVGYLTMQAVDSQRLLAQIITEARYTNARLEKIEATIERGIDDRYRGTDARRDFDSVTRTINALESRIRTIERHDQHLSSEILELQKRLGIPPRSHDDK